MRQSTHLSMYYAAFITCYSHRYWVVDDDDDEVWSPLPPSTSFCRFYTAILPIHIYIYMVETVSTATIVTAVEHTRKYLPTVFHAAYYCTHIISVYSKIHWNPFRRRKSSLYILYTRLKAPPPKKKRICRSDVLNSTYPRLFRISKIDKQLINDVVSTQFCKFSTYRLRRTPTKFCIRCACKIKLYIINTYDKMPIA